MVAQNFKNYQLMTYHHVGSWDGTACGCKAEHPVSIIAKSVVRESAVCKQLAINWPREVGAETVAIDTGALCI